MHNASVNHVDSMELAEHEPGRSLDDVCFRCFRDSVVERKEHNTGKMDNLARNGEDASGSDELGLKSMARRAVEHQSFGQLEDEHLLRQEDYISTR